MGQAALPYGIVSLLLGVVCVGVVFRFLRPRAEVTHTPRDKFFDRAAFDVDVYINRIRRIIRESNQGPSALKTLNGTETSEKHVLYKPPCQGLRHLQDMSITNYDELTLRDVEEFNSDITPGGSWKPPNCTAQHRVAIIIPYRDRYNHLVKLLSKLVPTLKQQNSFFKIYVTEQVGNNTFNKGVLMNAAFKEALKEEPWQCFVFHDVDLIPENVQNMYTCPWQPRHMSASIDEFGYRLPEIFDDLVGGVFAIKTEHFREVNGYSNSYWGWGAEDDDMTMRLFKKGFRIDRPPYHIARYQMVKHTKAKHNKHRYIIYNKNRKYYQKDGLNSLNYTLIRTIEKPLYTNFLIDVGRPPALWYFPES